MLIHHVCHLPVDDKCSVPVTGPRGRMSTNVGLSGHRQQQWSGPTLTMFIHILAVSAVSSLPLIIIININDATRVPFWRDGIGVTMACAISPLQLLTLCKIRCLLRLTYSYSPTTVPDHGHWHWHGMIGWTWTSVIRRPRGGPMLSCDATTSSQSLFSMLVGPCFEYPAHECRGHDVTLSRRKIVVANEGVETVAAIDKRAGQADSRQLRVPTCARPLVDECRQTNVDSRRSTGDRALAVLYMGHTELKEEGHELLDPHSYLPESSVRQFISSSGPNRVSRWL